MIFFTFSLAFFHFPHIPSPSPRLVIAYIYMSVYMLPFLLNTTSYSSYAAYTALAANIANDMTTWVCGYMTLQLYGYTAFCYMALWLYIIRFQIPSPDSHFLKRACPTLLLYCCCSLCLQGPLLLQIRTNRDLQHKCTWGKNFKTHYT